jgi:hypothetical protein
MKRLSMSARILLCALLTVLGCRPSATVSQSAVANALEVAKSEKPDSRWHVLTHKFAATGDNPAGWKIDPTTGNLVAPAGKVLEGLSQKGAVAATAVVNQTPLSGLAQTIDTIALSSDGLRTNLWNQTTTSEKGCWVVHSGAWTRCPDFAAGSSAYGAYFPSGGSANKGIYLVTAPAAGSDVVGTANLTAQNIASGGGGGLSSPLSAALDFGTNRATNAGTPVATTDLTTKAYVDSALAALGIFSADVATTQALPAYTYNNGAGTISFNSNVVCGSIDNVALAVTTNPPQRVLVNNAVNAFENGLYDPTQLGNGSSSGCVLTRDPAMDQTGEFAGSRVRILSGVLHGGATMVFAGSAPVTVGTSAVFFTDASSAAVDVYQWREEFDEPSFANGTRVGNSPLATSFVGGSVALGQANDANTFGTQSCQSGAGTTNRCGVVASTSGSFNDGGAFTLGVDNGVFINIRMKLNALSTGTDTYTEWLGAGDSMLVSFPNNLLGFGYQAQGTGNDTHWQSIMCASGSCTKTPSTVTVSSSSFANFVITKAPGSSTAFEYVEGSMVSGAGLTTGVPIGASIAPMINMLKSAGSANLTANYDLFDFRLAIPKGRAL